MMEAAVAACALCWAIALFASAALLLAATRASISGGREAGPGSVTLTVLPVLPYPFLLLMLLLLLLLLLLLYIPVTAE